MLLLVPQVRTEERLHRSTAKSSWSRLNCSQRKTTQTTETTLQNARQVFVPTHTCYILRRHFRFYFFAVTYLVCVVFWLCLCLQNRDTQKFNLFSERVPASIKQKVGLIVVTGGFASNDMLTLFYKKSVMLKLLVICF